MTTEIRRAWVVYDRMGAVCELRVDFTDKLEGFHICIPIGRDPEKLALALIDAARALGAELQHKGVTSV